MPYTTRTLQVANDGSTKRPVTVYQAYGSSSQRFLQIDGKKTVSDEVQVDGEFTKPNGGQMMMRKTS